MITLTPASQVPQIETQSQVLVSESGIIASNTNYLELITDDGVKFGIKNAYLNIFL